jgi:predicted DNA-binding transcriptional regulator AlpA
MKVSKAAKKPKIRSNPTPKAPEPTIPRLRKILRKRAVMALLGLGHSALADAVARGDLPKPINITEQGHVVGWFEDELIKHIEERAAARGDVYHPKDGAP